MNPHLKDALDQLEMSRAALRHLRQSYEQEGKTEMATLARQILRQTDDARNSLVELAGLMGERNGDR